MRFYLGTHLANWLVNHFGPIRVWPTTLYAPAGVYVVGLAFLLRDTVQRLAGQRAAMLAIAVGSALSVLVSPRLALASFSAFAASEALGLILFWAAGGNKAGPQRLAGAVVLSSVASAALDSYLFLAIAFGSLAFFEGQYVAKLSVTLLALPFVLAARRAEKRGRTLPPHLSAALSAVAAGSPETTSTGGAYVVERPR